MLDRVREAFCGLHGHDSMLQFEEDRMFLKCASCGHESPGWELNEPQTYSRRSRPTIGVLTAVGLRWSTDERRIA